MLTISSPNTDRSLLTLAELRAAAGLSDASNDVVLRALGGYVAAMITKACRVAVDGATPPTLRLESVSETFRLKAGQNVLVLSRRPVIAIAPVTENDEVLVAADYEVDASTGIFYRLSDTYRIGWPSGAIVVPYSAGFATVPDDLKYAAIKFVQAERQQGDRDPMLKSKTIEGVSSYEWWVDPTKDEVVPAEVMDILERGGYVNHRIV